MNTIKTKDKIEIKPGYKKTEVGVIPKEWKIQKLGDLTDIYDGTHQTPKYVDVGVPFYSVEHVSSNDFTNTKFISEEVFEKESERVVLEKGDVLMTRIGDVGTAKLIDWNVRASFYVSLALIKQCKELNSKFLEDSINGQLFQKELFKKIIHVAFPKKINLGDIRKLLIPIPPLPEQKAIADCLSTWDKGIEKLSALIASKKEQKKGLMQGLFSGKLKVENGQLIQAKDGEDFTKEWKEVKLGDISIKKTSNIQSGLLIENSGKYNVYGASGFITKIDTYDEEKPYIGIVKDGSGVGNTFLLEGKSSVLSTLDKILPKKNSNLVFLYSLIKKLNFEKYKVGGAIPHIYYNDYSKEKVLIPSLEEQTAIAEVLTTADKEIELLEQKLEAFKIQKKGLMQVLLTGTKRLVES